MKGSSGLVLVAAGLVLSTCHQVLAQGDPVVEWDLKSEESRVAVVTQLRGEAEAFRNAAWQSAADELWSPKGGGPGFQPGHRFGLSVDLVPVFFQPAGKKAAS